MPVYFARELTNIIDPRHFSPDAKLDPGARVRRVENYNNRFGRYYSPEAFEERIVKASNKFEIRLVRVEVIPDPPGNTYLRYACVLKLRGQ